MRTEKGHIVETAVEARAGFLDRPMLAVLEAHRGALVAELHTKKNA
jgi:hypothetical protein